MRVTRVLQLLFGISSVVLLVLYASHDQGRRKNSPQAFKNIELASRPDVDRIETREPRSQPAAVVAEEGGARGLLTQETLTKPAEAIPPKVEIVSPAAPAQVLNLPAQGNNDAIAHFRDLQDRQRMMLDRTHTAAQPMRVIDGPPVGAQQPQEQPQQQLQVPVEKPVKDAADNHRKDAFDRVFRFGMWGDGFGTPKSGGGSTVGFTETARKIIGEVIEHYDIQTMLDIPCGDMTWMPLVLEAHPKLSYLGADIVDEIVRVNTEKFPNLKFVQLDVVKDPLPAADVIFCRDALQHLPRAEVQAALENISKSGAKYLLTSSYLRQSREANEGDINPGDCLHRDLMKSPYFLADPLVIYSENDRTWHKFLGLWKLPLTYDRAPQQ